MNNLSRPTIHGANLVPDLTSPSPLSVFSSLIPAKGTKVTYLIYKRRNCWHFLQNSCNYCTTECVQLPLRDFSSSLVLIRRPSPMPIQQGQHNILMKVKLVPSPVSCASRGGVARCPGRQLPVAHSVGGKSDVPLESFTFASFATHGLLRMKAANNIPLSSPSRVAYMKQVAFNHIK